MAKTNIGDAHDPESPISKFLEEHETFRLREDFGTEPKVHYVRPVKPHYQIP